MAELANTLQLRRGLKREDAAVYVGVGVTKFDQMVEDGRMPSPKKIDGRKVWDVRALDVAFEDLPDWCEANAKVNSWSDVA